MKKCLTALTLLVALSSQAVAKEDGEVLKLKLENKSGVLNAYKVGEKEGKLKIYEIRVKDDKNGVLLTGKAYRFGDLFFVNAYRLRKDGTLYRLKDVSYKEIPVDISFLKEIEKIMKERGFKYEVGSGKKVLYVVFDPFCPYCAREMSKLDEIKKKYRIKFIPFPIHGERAEKVLACLFGKSRKVGIDEPLRENFQKLEKFLRTRSGEKFSSYIESCNYSKEDLEAIKKIAEILLQNEVKGTPTFFVEKENDKYYKRVGAIK